MRSERVVVALLSLACFVDCVFLVWAARQPALGALEIALLLAQALGLVIGSGLIFAAMQRRRVTQPRDLRAIQELLGELG